MQGEYRREIIPLKDIQETFGWGMNPDHFLFLLLISEFGLKLIKRSDELPDDVECGSWVLGPGSGHYFDFAGKGKVSDTFRYGALAEYGIYTVPDGNAPNRFIFTSRQEALEIRKNGSRAVEYEEKHLGVTTKEGTIISKWGRGRNGHVVEHLPHIVPYMYGEVSYTYFSCSVLDKDGQQQEILIMPHYVYGDTQHNFEIVLTDGNKQVGTIGGLLKGTIGTKDSTLEITYAENISQSTFPTLVRSLIPFISEQRPAIANILWFSNTTFVGEDPSLQFISEWS